MATVAFPDFRQLVDEQVRLDARLHVHEVLGDDQIQVDVRVRCQKLRQPRCQPQAGKRRRAAQCHHPFALVLPAYTAGDLGDVAERQLHGIEKDRAFGRKRHRPPVADEQLSPHETFQLTYLLADRGLGDAQRLRRAGEIEVLRRCDKRLYGTQRRHLYQCLIGLCVLDH
ncbi:hypothetical protein D3C77_525830 [compost metagenome]